MTDVQVNSVLDGHFDRARGLLYDYQRDAVACPARFTRSVWSRQTGKSHGFSFRRIVRGLARRKDQIFLSASQAQSNELVGKARMHLEAMKIICDYHEQELFDEAGTQFTQRILTLPLGVRIIALPANPATIRGYTGDVLADEFAMHKHDREIWAAAFAIATRGRGEIDVCSTPQGRQNMFYRLGANEAFHQSTVTIYDAIAGGLPDVDAEELRVGLGDEELFRQEYLCEFLDEATAFIPFEWIGRAEDLACDYELSLDLLADWPTDVYVGIDIGRKRDLTVVWAFEQDGEVFKSLGLLEMRGVKFREQFERISAVLKNRCVRRCAIDSTGLGMQLAEDLADRFGSWKVEPCPFTPKLKEAAAGALRVKFDDGTIRIPIDAKLRNDLHSIRKVVTAAGNVRLDAPREEGSHADRFWAAALACHAASDAVGPIECQSGGAARTRDLVPAGRGRAW